MSMSRIGTIVVLSAALVGAVYAGNYTTQAVRAVHPVHHAKAVYHPRAYSVGTLPVGYCQNLTSAQCVEYTAVRAGMNPQYAAQGSQYVGTDPDRRIVFELNRDTSYSRTQAHN